VKSTMVMPIAEFSNAVAFGVDAGETMSCAQIAMMAGLPYTALRETHPTLAEGLITLFSSSPSTPGPADANI